MTEAETIKKTPLDSINLKIKGQDGIDVFFQIKRNTVLKKALESYCYKRNFQYKTMEFLYKGSRFQHKLTAEALNMKEVDEIDAMWHQHGGGCVGK